MSGKDSNRPDSDHPHSPTPREKTREEGKPDPKGGEGLKDKRP
ncbi:MULTISPECIES: hypothetical protein [Pacificimonas]|nr:MULTISPECIES: hypothetical protein [Pacificimonas]